MLEDRVLILELTAMSKQFAQNGADRSAAVTLDAALRIHEAEVERAREQVRLERDARRHRKQRDPATPRTSAEVHGTPRPSAEAPNGFPTPFPLPQKNSTTPSTRAREEQLEQQTGASWPEISAFLLRRDPGQREGFAGSMLWCKTAMGAEPSDIAQVCLDDLALKRPIGTPKGFRMFMRHWLEERRREAKPTPDLAAAIDNMARPVIPVSRANGGKGGKGGSGGNDDAAAMRTLSEIRASVKENYVIGQGVRRYIPADGVKALGKAAWDAYRQIGGAERVLAEDPQGFVLRDFIKAFKGCLRHSGGDDAGAE